MTISVRFWVVLSLVGLISVFYLSYNAQLPPSSHRTWLESIFQSTTNEDATIQPPHIVFVLADDLSWNALGGFDSESDIAFVAPGLASFATQGIKMTNYYAQELCTPSRAALLTGRYPVSMGMQYGTVMASKAWGMPLDETTIAEVLRDAGGYATHAVGKWHLGHHTPNYLPTARGFQTFTGYLDGENNYFSKQDPQVAGYRDFMISDTSCFYAYNQSDMTGYSTHLYRDMAIKIIQQHDVSIPLFLYLAFQAVHTPFEDAIGNQIIPKEYVDAEIYEKIMTTVKGTKRQLYAMALASMDAAITDVVTALDKTGMLPRTYLIFASDNGGCYLGGGKNAPLRGTKATILEGGTRVDAFIYSPLLSTSVWQGKEYPHLMHVTDWFPTMLDMAGIHTIRSTTTTASSISATSAKATVGTASPMVYTPAGTTVDGSKSLVLDGVSHWTTFRGLFATTSPARTKMLYNSFVSIIGANRDMWTNGTFAIRNERYKLAHFYNSSRYAKWYETDDGGVLDDDDQLESKQCQYTSAQAGIKHGVSTPPFVYTLFDLQNDPFEHHNLYDMGTVEIEAIKTELYQDLATIHARATHDHSEGIVQQLASCEVTWMTSGGYVMPFESTVNDGILMGLTGAVKSAPLYCGIWDDSKGSILAMNG